MLALRGIYENGEFKLNKPIIAKKTLKFIITFIEENVDISYQSEVKEEELLAENLENYQQLLLTLKAKYSDLPITWSNKKPNPDDFFGIWSDKNINLEQLREKAWKRK